MDDKYNISAPLGTENTIQVTAGGAFLVEGIEDWIEALLPAQTINEKDEYNLVRMVDPKTGALFAITRLRQD